MKKILCTIAILSFGISSCGKLSEEELWKRAEAAKSNSNFDSTIQVAQKILKDYPKGKFASASLFSIAESYYRGKKDARAGLSYYKLFVERYPDLNATPVALFIVGFIYNNELHMIDSARVHYELFLNKFPQHQLAQSAQFELATLGKPPEEIIPHPTPQILLPPSAQRNK